MCYLPLPDEVTSYQEAEDLCKEKDSVLPLFHLQDYVNFTKCVDLSWKYPLTLFFQPSLSRTSDKCIASTFMNEAEFSTISRCSLKNKAKVMCEIRI
ncbi:hypothetical protein Avbf_11529 [Armadillidium vulgare]|nr:hypothetical protein Avbf_11529 [Armadillidium vulgare]